MNLILNLLWLICGGFFAGLAWIFVAFVCALSIVGLPWARAAFNIGIFTLWPFGQTAINRQELTGRPDLGTSIFGELGNVVWLVLAGWWLALGHLTAAIALTFTIIGIPFAYQHLKLAIVGLWPIGVAIVPNEIAAGSRQMQWLSQRGGWRA